MAIPVRLPCRLIATCLVAVLAACAIRSPYAPIRDVRELDQDAGAYHHMPPDQPVLAPQDQARAWKAFLAEHFGPWDRPLATRTADEVFWGFKRFRNTRIFGENTLPRDAAWLDRMKRLSRTAEYPSLIRPVIATAETSMRVFPSADPVFLDFSRAGEGFPFDYGQNSLVQAGTPLLATHQSVDRAWIMVESRFAFGWVRAQDIALANREFRKTFRAGHFAAITRDNVSLIDADGGFRFKAGIGTILPLMEHRSRQTGQCLAVMIPVRDANGTARTRTALLPPDKAEPAPIPATPRNFARLANEMLGQPYGWGGLYGKRDCSATTMDLLAGFGLFLPRNSTQQAGEGDFTSLRGLTAQEKKDVILKQGIPFRTLIRKPGHIMLYIGHADRNGRPEPIVLHATWGLKTGSGPEYGRKIIGDTVITTLEPGRELPELTRPGGLLIESVTGMTILPGTGSEF
ncbi:SH3 domain-containing protein [Pseudodesulfovibrio tunisiensis]|uniref:SH3 domain-containing protein n=1 Tax=Pseudodesulfovibrio tunisiensis TaxID=463192 RepID=UPI001FB2FFA0|nr:NlpC/P60 family N-terminal domain-containing protein [Pseudodesulfovibrio tunisiensis]